MSKKPSLLNRLQGWFQKQFNLTVKQSDNTQIVTTKLKQLNENKLSNPQADITSEVNTFKPKTASPFILGLENVKDLSSLTNNNFQKLIQWNWFGKNSFSKIEVPEREDFSTEVLLNSISWDSETIPNIEQVNVSLPVIPVSPPFLVGLEDIPNLEQIISKDFLNLINWEVNTQIGLPVEVEDYSLLDDLLETFPE